MEKEENAIVLDFLANGYPFDNRPAHLKTPVAQALGINRFVLLELVPKKGISLQPNQHVYIGEGKREEIHHINGKIDYSKLTSTARSEVDEVIKELVHKNPKRFVSFFNTAQPLTTRMHQLELLPGLGKKHMWEILDERDIKPFEDFNDIKKRVKLMPDPEKAIIKRILKEIQGEEKHRIFAE
ncbi:DUF655 domain-containing protein [Candidatus Woesearchaeota archaeon]|nr:DUF655 domain-containing protein [Candidatus Woesearchaeota archaeon]